MRTPPLLDDFIHPRNCKPICEKLLTLPSAISMKFSRCNGGAISFPSSFRPLPSDSYTPWQTMRPTLPAVQISLWAYLSQTKDTAPFDTLSVLHHFWQKHEEWGRRRTKPHKCTFPSNGTPHLFAPYDVYQPPYKCSPSTRLRSSIAPMSYR